MCGICGVLSFSGPEPLRPLEDLVALMERRGPDDEGLWSDGARCAFGFRRLAVQDLTPAGHQPMQTRDGRYVIVFNGEVYNFHELRAELQSAGYVFRSTGDTEVVLNALAHWGKPALERFNGMFALAFYDVQDKRLLLARDHAGIKPLYVLHTPQAVVFASQYDQILAHPASRACPVSADALGLYLRLGYMPAPYALLRDSQMVSAGSWLEIDAQGRRQEGRFFEFPRWREADLFGDAAVEALDSALTASVASQLVSDVPVGTFLSGGIDSPLVAAKIHALGRQDVTAYTIGTAGHASDESGDARIYAEQIGIRQVVEQITPEQSLALIDDVVEACGEPFGDFSLFPTLLVSRLARRDVTVMLSGDGGDELFWGYAKRFADIVEHSPDFAQPLLLRKLRWGLKRYLGVGDAYSQITWPTLGDWYRSKQTLLHDAWLDEIFPDGPYWPQSYRAFDYAGRDRTRTAQWARHNEFVGRMQMILLKVDRASMHESLEVRVPLLDRRVIDVASRTDWRSCLDLERKLGKLPLRRLLARHITHQTQAKRGFTVPMGLWLKGPLRERFETEVLPRQDFLGFPVDRHALRRRFIGFLSGATDEAWGLWLLMSLALWERQHYHLRQE